MPAGPIGSVWSPGSWSDLAWEENTWADAVIPALGDITMSFMIGIPYTLTAGVVYATPTRRTLCYVQQSGGTIEQSNDGSTFAAVTLDDDEQFEAGAAFIRAVTTDAIVKFKVG